MRKKLFILSLFMIVWGIMGIITPVSALPPEEESLPVFEGFSDNRVGKIVIDPVHAQFTIMANVCEQRGKAYYEIMAYNPSGVPPMITWGMIKRDRNGQLCCNDNFDTDTLAWIKRYGLTEAIYSVRPI
jgi:hypothetical protein